jgi:fumarate reductase subunit D
VTTRSKQPMVWLLFGAGGMLSALVGWMLVFITGISIPMGSLFSPETFSYANMLAFHQHWLGKAFTLAVIALFLWHAALRIYHSLYDLGVKSHTATGWAVFGIAAMGSGAAAYALLAIGR